MRRLCLGCEFCPDSSGSVGLRGGKTDELNRYEVILKLFGTQS